MSELYYFYFDQIKDVIGEIAARADQNDWINSMMPTFFEQVRRAERMVDLNKLNPAKTLDIEGVRKNISNVIQNTNNSKRLSAAKAIVKKQKAAIAEVAKVIGYENFSNPLKFRLRDVNKEEFLKVAQDVQTGQFNLAGFEKYFAARFDEIFADEKSKIKVELNKFESVEAKERSVKKLKTIFSEAPVMKLARRVGGVCVSGDEAQWNDPTYKQVVYFDENDISVGVTMMNIWEDRGKKYLVISPNPSQTYLYGVDEKALYKGIVNQIIEFAKRNDIDAVGFSSDRRIRTNRTGGEFEKAMDSQISEVGKNVEFSEEKIFAIGPSYNYKVNKVDLVWVKRWGLRWRWEKNKG